MHQPPLPLTRDLVLIGGGHTHALLLRKWGMSPLPGARLTVINPGPTAPYSGMLPGFVAGHYDRADLDIDLIRLSRFAGARIVLGAATGIDLERREILVPDRPPIGFDVASIDIGITSEMPTLPGFTKHAVPAKPLGSFAARWDSFLNNTGPAKIAVIGGGVAGVELILAMAHALRSRSRLDAAYLIDSAEILTTIGPKAQAKMRAKLDHCGVQVLENTNVEAITSTSILLADGRSLNCNFITGTAGARPYEWLANSGLETRNGFVVTDVTLRTSDPAIFATGDCGHFAPDPRPKAGVFAVRQAPVLFQNLRATLSGRNLRSYKPQKDYLKLISMGQKQALGERFGATFSGPLIWKWKDHIDQTFMSQFREYPEMERPGLPALHTEGLGDALGDKPACGGCGSKIGRSTLQNVLKTLPRPDRPDIVSLPGDDAASLVMGDTRQVISADHLRALTPDPVVVTKIAALHALGDIWAMGGVPQSALASIILPRLSTELQERTLSEVMTVAHEVFANAGAAIIGGHSSVGDEMTLGFTVTGLCSRAPISLSGARPDDQLILTKPIGSGTVMAAEMTGLARGEWVASALDAMTQSQGSAARILADAHAMTDVTGFGLAGHLIGMCEASGVAARINVERVPFLPGAQELAQDGIRSTLYPENRLIVPGLPQNGDIDLLFDPQTAGGLLAAVSPKQAPEIVESLKKAGYSAACIGEFFSGAPDLHLS
ncbi:MAG: selenide, water dikinase SelD [Paracoccaceae bacterium]